MTVVSVAAVATSAARSALEWLGFWSAVAIPLGYFYLFYNGLTAPELATLSKLFGLHVVAFIAGRGYNVGAAPDRPTSYQEQNRTV